MRGNILAKIKSSPKGFTLVELMVMVFIVATMSLAAITNFLSTNMALEFNSTYTGIISTVRATRALALTNTDPSGASTPTRYGIELDTQSAVIFADNGTTPYTLDGSDEVLTNKSFYFDDTDHSLDETPTNGSTQGDGFEPPVYLYFEAGSGDMLMYENTTEIEDRCLAMLVQHDLRPTQFTRYFIIFKASGIAEPFEDVPSC